MLNHLLRLFVMAVLGLNMAALAQSSGPGQSTNALQKETDAPKRPYILSPDDVIQLKVYQEEDLDTKVTIDNQGMATLPMLGAVKVSGMTVEAAGRVVHDLYAKDYLVNPQVTLVLVEAGKRRFSVLGQVQRPGTFDYPADQPVNLLQALSMAGGFTRMGSTSKVLVTRIENGETKVYQISAEVLAKERNPKPFEIMPDDVINVGAKLF